MRFRVEYGWGDREQSLIAYFEAEDEVQARRTAVSLMARIQINGAWVVGADNQRWTPIALQKGGEMVSYDEPAASVADEPVDLARYQRPTPAGEARPG